LVRQVLVQRKPDGWQKMHPKKIDRLVLRNPVKLIGKKVYVRPHSAHETRLQNLSEEIGGDILIRQADPDLETEDLIRMVAEGEIDYTIAEADIATVNARYHPNIDVETAVSFPQRIAWGIRKNAPELRKSLNKWLADIKDGPAYTTIYNRYFKKRERSLNPENEFFAVSEVSGGKISPYDDLIRDAAADLGWDWRLLAAQIYKESQFNPKAVSWAGAQGLMQLMPGTALAHNVTDPTDPNQSIKAGKRHLKWLQNIWKDKIEDPEERIKFILASYNVGQGHVMDARALAQKYGHSGQVWDDEVEAFLLKKSQRKYYSDPVVKYGYCKGKETVLYVKKIFSIYESYLELISA